MTMNAEIVVEGSYNYFQTEKLYSTENFKLYRKLEAQTLFFDAEILSRIETGEFLKIKVFYELSSNFTPIAMKIERSLGDRHSIEKFEIASHEQLLHYEYITDKDSFKISKHHSPKHYLSSPAVCTSAAFTLSKKIDATDRTPIILVCGHDSWDSFKARPVENMIYAQLNIRESTELELNGQFLQAQSLLLYPQDSSIISKSGEQVELLLSKHFAIPYKLLHKGLKIEIKELKRID